MFGIRKKRRHRNSVVGQIQWLESGQLDLEKYQISLGEVVSANYVKKFLTKNENELFLMTGKIIKGHNPNEVILVKKTQKNQGFFEKFFNFFN